MSSFAKLGVSAPVCRALAQRGFDSPFPIQSMVMRDALAGRDVLAKSRTGSGKTLAFGIPIVERLARNAHRPSALVLVPTRELAGQVTEELHSVATIRGLRVAPVYGGVSLGPQAKQAQKAHIIVATPGRMQDLLERRLISLARVSILVLDEADRMLDMGFQPQVDRIVKHLNNQRQTMMFSATLDGAVGRLARAYTNNPARHEVAERRLVIEEATHRFVPVDDQIRVERLVELLNEERDLALVFVRTKRGADRLRKRLAASKVNAGAMHGNMSQGARRKALERFADGRVNVLVATDVAARGLDLDGITHVINFDPPADRKDYVHRVGRTARAGRSGTGVTLVAPHQLLDVGNIARELHLHNEFQAEGLMMSKPQRVFSSHRGRSGGGRARRRRS